MSAKLSPLFGSLPGETVFDAVIRQVDGKLARLRKHTVAFIRIRSMLVRERNATTRNARKHGGQS